MFIISGEELFRLPRYDEISVSFDVKRKSADDKGLRSLAITQFFSRAGLQSEGSAVYFWSAHLS